MKTILLKHGQVAIVDDEDYEWLSSKRWSYHKVGYVYQFTRENGRGVTKYMHREILHAPKGIEVDHINHNRLDNRRCNLRLATKSQNLGNRGKQSNKHGTYKGVYYNKERGNWYAQVTCEGRTYTIGGLSSPIEAALAYDQKAIQLFGEYAMLNLAPGCDLQDMMAWLEANEPVHLAAITSPSQTRQKTK